MAITTMLEAHGLGRRKAGRGFEATHVLSVAMIVEDFGFAEDAVVAAILHDALEDTTLERDVIRQQFGERVLAIVSDVTEPPKRIPWRARKETYIERPAPQPARRRTCGGVGRQDPQHVKYGQRFRDTRPGVRGCVHHRHRRDDLVSPAGAPDARRHVGSSDSRRTRTPARPFSGRRAGTLDDRSTTRCALLAPSQTGASPVSVRRGTFTTCCC